MSAPLFEINPSLDVADAADRFARTGRARITDFLKPDGAEALFTGLRSRSDWRRVINSGPDKVIELDRETSDSLTAEQRARLDDAVYAGARTGFQFRYETIRVPDEEEARRRSDDPLACYALWLSSGPARDLLRQITGTQAIDFADAQGTAYGPGDFLTGHDDEVAGKGRYAAYVLGLTPIWRPEWGGLLVFHDADEFVAYPPSFNCLNLFRVPQLHSVSEVTRAAAYRRYSITGWLRSR